MITKALKREENLIRAEFPNAVGFIENFQMQGKRISFELVYYADKEAYDMIKNPSTTLASHVGLPTNGGIIARKPYNEDASIIEQYESDITDESLLERLLTCCYSWLEDRSLDK